LVRRIKIVAGIGAPALSRALGFTWKGKGKIRCSFANRRKVTYCTEASLKFIGEAKVLSTQHHIAFDVLHIDKFGLGPLACSYSEFDF
jgi:hypothetical protein